MFPPVVALVHEMRIAQAAVDPAMQQVVDIMPAQQQAHPLGERPGDSASNGAAGAPHGDGRAGRRYVPRRAGQPFPAHTQHRWLQDLRPSTTKPLMLSPESLRTCAVPLLTCATAIECGARFGRLPRVFKNQPVPFVHESICCVKRWTIAAGGLSRIDRHAAAGRRAFPPTRRQPDDQVRPLRQRAHRRQQAQSARRPVSRSRPAARPTRPPRVPLCAWPQAGTTAARIDLCRRPRRQYMQAHAPLLPVPPHWRMP